MKELLTLLAPVFLCQLALLTAAVWAFLLVETASDLIKFIAVPMAIGISILVPFLLTPVLGKALPVQELPSEFTVIGHYTIIQSGKKTHIEIWTQDDSSTKLYAIPYIKELEKQLDNGAQARVQGKQVKMMRSADTNEFEMQILDPADIMPPK